MHRDRGDRENRVYSIVIPRWLRDSQKPRFKLRAARPILTIMRIIYYLHHIVRASASVECASLCVCVCLFAAAEVQPYVESCAFWMGSPGRNDDARLATRGICGKWQNYRCPLDRQLYYAFNVFYWLLISRIVVGSMDIRRAVWPPLRRPLSEVTTITTAQSERGFGWCEWKTCYSEIG